MVANDKQEELVQKVDAALKEWHQGDFVLGEQGFVYRIDPQLPLTEASLDAGAEGGELVESMVRGFVVVTQTCDIVRSCSKRPFVEVVPLTEVDEQKLNEIQRGRRPQYAFIPGCKEHCLVADLDRVMTVEKAVIIGWERRSGCQNDQDIRLLGKALARKRIRFAFPDDFVEWTKKLQEQFQKKHDKFSPEGEALRSLREIRVRAAPSWNESEIELMFWFIRHEEEVQFQGTTWDTLLQQWLKLIPPSGRFQFVYGQVATLEEITARDYLESDPLDFDHLSH